MNVCEFCGESFPNITELYKHKLMHKQNLLLHTHGGKDVIPYRGTVGEEKMEYREGPPNLEYREDLPKIKYHGETEVAPFVGKRKRDLDSDSEDEYETKRYRKDLVPIEGRSGLEVVPYVKPRKKKPKRKFIKPRSEDDSDLEDRKIKKYITKFEREYEEELQDQKQIYKKQLTRREDEIEKFKKQCKEYIASKEKEILDLQKKNKKELEEQKDMIEETEKHYKDQVKLLSEKIKSLEAEDASFKSLSDVIFNCITIEEIFKIRKLVRNREFEELIEKHLGTLQKLFLSLSYGVIPICQPQRDVISDSQKKLIEKIETSTPSKAKSIIMQNRSDIVNIFEIIDQSLELATTSYDKFRRL